MRPLYEISDPNFQGVFFRRTTKALEKPGSLWPEGKKLWSGFNCKVRERDHQHIFPTGATLSMDHLEHEKDAEGNHQGTQYSFVGFDELTHFTQLQFLYLVGRLRSAAEGNSSCMATCNPDPDSWVYPWVEWWLTEDGYFDESKLGRIRYFVTVDESPVFADSAEELAERFPHICYQENPLTGEMVYVPPLSFSFVGGTIFDNPALIAANPKYLAALKAQSEVNRARLLDGNWHARPEGSGYFDRDWLVKVDKLPANTTFCRAWDKASQEPSDVNRYPDYTASVRMHKDKDGFYYICGGYHPENKDKDSDILGRFRKRPGERDQLILKQAETDSQECVVVLPVDPAAAGKVEFQESSKKLICEGFRVKQDPMPSNKSKITKYSPFSSACQTGLVRIVESTFPNKATLEAFYKENEAFDGERSTSARKDDWPDCCASAFNYLAKSRVYKTPIVTETSKDTLVNPVLDHFNTNSVNELPRVDNLNQNTIDR